GRGRVAGPTMKPSRPLHGSAVGTTKRAWRGCPPRRRKRIYTGRLRKETREKNTLPAGNGEAWKSIGLNQLRHESARPTNASLPIANRDNLTAPGPRNKGRSQTTHNRRL